MLENAMASGCADFGYKWRMHDRPALAVVLVEGGAGLCYDVSAEAERIQREPTIQREVLCP
jgi:hypothetical protein